MGRMRGWVPPGFVVAVPIRRPWALRLLAARRTGARLWHRNRLRLCGHKFAAQAVADGRVETFPNALVLPSGVITGSTDWTTSSNQKPTLHVSSIVGRHHLRDFRFTAQRHQGQMTAYHRRNLAWDQLITVDEPVVVCDGPLAGNWHHWLLEYLPSAFAAFADRPCRVVLREHPGMSTNHRAAAERCFGVENVISVGARSAVAAPQIRVASRPLTYLNPARDFPTSQFMQYREVFIGNEFGATEGPPGLLTQKSPEGRIFLTRPGFRRPSNESDVQRMLERDFGFTGVDPAGLSLEDQIELFRSAAVVVGPSGAAFAGILFMQAGTNALVIGDTLPSIWSSIAKLNGVGLAFQPWESYRYAIVGSQGRHRLQRFVSPSTVLKHVSLLLSGRR